jgi:hypothetical protein
LALAVPLSRFTLRVGGGSAFFVRPRYDATQKYVTKSNHCHCAGGVVRAHLSSSISTGKGRDAFPEKHGGLANDLWIHFVWVATVAISGFIRGSVVSLDFRRDYFDCPSNRTGGADASLFALATSGSGCRIDSFLRTYGSSILFIESMKLRWPNKSPEPTAVGAVRSAIAVHVAGRRWLSFLR